MGERHCGCRSYCESYLGASLTVANTLAGAPGSIAGRPTLNEIYQRESGYVWSTLRRLGVQSRDLEDLMHDTFIVVNRRLCDFDSSRPVRPWLYGIAMRIAADARKSARNRREQLSSELPESVSQEPGPAEEVSAQQNRKLVLAALNQLEFKHRVIFVMHDINEHTLAEAAATLETPMATLYSRLRVAREHFAVAVRRLGRDGGES